MIDLLIIAPSSAGLYQELKKDFSAKETNIWAGLLANSVRGDHSVLIYDMEIERPSKDKFYETVKEINPSLVLFVFNSLTMDLLIISSIYFKRLVGILPI